MRFNSFIKIQNSNISEILLTVFTLIIALVGGLAVASIDTSPVFLAIVLGFLAIVFLLAVIRWPMILTLFIPFLLGIEYRIELGFGSFTLAEVCTVLIWIVAMIQFVKERRALSFIDKRELALAFLVVLASFVGVFFMQDKRRALSVWRDFAAPLLFFIGFLLAGLNKKQVILLVKVYLLVATANAILGVVQFWTGSYLWMTAYGTTGMAFKIGLIRNSTIASFLGIKNVMAAGLFSSYGNFGWYLIMPVIISFVFSTAADIRWYEKLLSRIAFVLLLLALTLTFARASLFTAIIPLGILIVYRGRRSLSLISLIGVGIIMVILLYLAQVLGIVSFGGFDVSILSREVLLKFTLLLFQKYPYIALFGGGMERYMLLSYSGSIQIVHNIILYFLMQFGLIPLIGWMVLIVINLRKLSGLFLNSSDWVSKMGLALLLGLGMLIFFYEQTTNAITNVLHGTMIFFWVAVGSCLYRLYHAESTVQIPENETEVRAASLQAAGEQV